MSNDRNSLFGALFYIHFKFILSLHLLHGSFCFMFVCMIVSVCNVLQLDSCREGILFLYMAALCIISLPYN